MTALHTMLNSPFAEFAAILMIAAIVGGLATLLRQPLIVAFIAVGIMVGPAWLDIVTQSEQIELFGSLGIAILLFVVGLRLDLNVIRTMGPVAFTIGIVQMLATAALALGLTLMWSMPLVTAAYIAMALAFSSTIIIVKLLSDKREIDALHGRIAVGVLIVQDMAVVGLMIVLSALGVGSDVDHPLWSAIQIVLKGVGLLIVLGLLMRFVLPWLTHQMARHQELLLLFAIAWATAWAALAESAGLTQEVGAFLAGVSLASTPFRESISGRMTSLRDFLLLFFFVDMGSRINVDELDNAIAPALVLSVFVLLGKPLIVLTIMSVMGYRRRTSFLTASSLGQISEFSLILAALGASLGHVDESTTGLITLIGLITIGISAFIIQHSHDVFERLSPLLKLFQRQSPSREQTMPGDDLTDIDAIVFGLGRYGENISHQLQQRGFKILGIDFDPQVVQRWRHEHRPVQYGDAEDPEFAANLPLNKARIVISTMPQLHINKTLLSALRESGFRKPVVVTAHSHHDSDVLKRAGAALVLLPFSDAAVQAADCIEETIGHRS